MRVFDYNVLFDQLIQDSVDPVTGEIINPDFEAQLAALEMSRDEKAEQVALAYKKSKGDVPSNRWLGFKFENVNFDLIGRFGLVYNCMRWYAGASIILRSYNYRKLRFSTNNTFGSMNIYIGYNFGLKPRYRENHETHY